MALENEPDILPGYVAELNDQASTTGPGTNAYLNADDRASVAANGKTSYTISQAANQIIRSDAGWGGVLGHAATVTYAYRSTTPSSMPDDTAGFSRFNTAQIAQAELALKAWSDVANITFIRVGAGDSGDNAYSNNATILLANYSSGESGASAFAMYPGSTSASAKAGDLWVNSTFSYNQAPTVGNYGGMVLVHELGHTIGLAHPSDYDATGDTTLTYSSNASYYEDSRQYTVMSYFSETNTGGSDGGRYSAAPLLDDIAAAQMEYGANMTTRTGDTVYGFNSNIDDRPWYSTTSNANKVIFAVWDAGGTDTLDFSGYTQTQLIDLREGNFSNVGGLTGNVAIAVGAQIENAVGGSGVDVIYGNALANLISGGGGNDTIDGGAGIDTAQYSGASSSYSWTKRSDGAWIVQDLRGGSPDGTDVLTNIENLKFSDHTVALGGIGLSSAVETAFSNLTRAGSGADVNKALALDISNQMAGGTMSQAQAFVAIEQAAKTTTAVATLSYEFFTGKVPTEAGVDYLVSPTGPNANNLNSTYYQSFNLENRYINFAVNLGKNGEGQAAFAAKYGALSLVEATATAYQTIFGGAPSDAKVHALIDSRVDYFAAYGGDGPAGIGTKAAMVGWLLAEAVKADVGTYAKVGDAFMADLTDGAAFAVDIVGVYNHPEYSYTPT
jgi:serralysin